MAYSPPVTINTHNIWEYISDQDVSNAMIEKKFIRKAAQKQPS
jgi:hypothetical protein